VAAVTDPLHVAAVTGTCSAVGMAELMLGGGYGPLIGRFGLALDNLLAARVVLTDGRTVVASRDNEEELFWGHRRVERPPDLRGSKWSGICAR
jgi:FAD/FMN-containing dehydrogenase